MGGVASAVGKGIAVDGVSLSGEGKAEGGEGGTGRGGTEAARRPSRATVPVVGGVTVGGVAAAAADGAADSTTSRAVRGLTVSAGGAAGGENGNQPLPNHSPCNTTDTAPASHSRGVRRKRRRLGVSTVLFGFACNGDL